MRIHMFNDVPGIRNIENYKDFTHFHPTTNSMFLHAIHDNQHILTTDNADKYLQDIEHRAQKFNWDYYIKQLENMAD